MFFLFIINKDDAIKKQMNEWVHEPSCCYSEDNQLSPFFTRSEVNRHILSKAQFTANLLQKELWRDLSHDSSAGAVMLCRQPWQQKHVGLATWDGSLLLPSPPGDHPLHALLEFCCFILDGCCWHSSSCLLYDIGRWNENWFRGFKTETQQ